MPQSHSANQPGHGTVRKRNQIKSLIKQKGVHSCNLLVYMSLLAGAKQITIWTTICPAKLYHQWKFEAWSSIVQLKLILNSFKKFNNTPVLIQDPLCIWESPSICLFLKIRDTRPKGSQCSLFFRNWQVCRLSLTQITPLIRHCIIALRIQKLTQHFCHWIIFIFQQSLISQRKHILHPRGTTQATAAESE